MPRAKILSLLILLAWCGPVFGQESVLRGSDDPSLRPLGDSSRSDTGDGEETAIDGGDAETRTAARRGLSLPLSRPVSTPSGSPTSTPLSTPEGRPALEEKAEIARRRRTGGEEEAGTFFSPSGIAFGSFRLYPSLGLYGGYTTAAGSAGSSKPSWLYRIAPELAVRSNWSRHELELTLRGTYDGLLAKGVPDDPSLEGALRGRYDLSRRTDIELKGGYKYSLEALTSAEVPAGSSRSAEIHTLTGGVAVTHRPGKLGVTVGVDAERNRYVGGDYGNGDRDNIAVSGRLRLTYFGGGILKPFVEGAGIARLYDRKVDSNGNRRDALGYGLRTGLVVDMGPKLTGEIAAGYRAEYLDDKALGSLEGFVFNAGLTWSPQRRTTVTFNADTSFNASSLAGSPGSIGYSATLGLRRSLRRNLEINGGLGLAYTTYSGLAREDLTTTATVGLTWALNPNLAFSAVYEFENLRSTNGASDYLDNTFRLGLVMRR